MSVHLHPALRPMLPTDGPVLAAIFRAAIDELTGEDYSPAQREAWMAAADDEAAFAKRLAARLTLLATINHEPVGFAAMKNNDHIDMLYVHPRVAGRGVANALCEAMEVLAAARGTKKITTEASDTARPLFAKRGYTPTRRNTVLVGEEWLGNTAMEKILPPRKAAVQ